MPARICIAGVGLIGGSLALALKRSKAVGHVVGFGCTESNLKRAVESGVIDSYATDAAAAVHGTQLVVLAVPLGATVDVLRAMQPGLAADVVLTDVGSAKRCVIKAAAQVFGSVPERFVPGHPIAGTERSGVEAAFESLFDDHRVILTPLEHTDAGALELVQNMWQSAGAEVLMLEPEHHDQVLAATSHLPHMLAYTLVDVLGRMEEHTEMFRYAAGGFRDFTRIASSDPTMWHDICIANRDALLAALERFGAELDQVRDMIRQGDSAGLQRVFSRAKSLRDAHVAPPQGR